MRRPGWPAERAADRWRVSIRRAHQNSGCTFPAQQVTSGKLASFQELTGRAVRAVPCHLALTAGHETGGAVLQYVGGNYGSAQSPACPVSGDAPVRGVG
jgi:hypothetical protein